MEIQIEKSWKNILHKEFEKDYFIHLVNFVKAAYQKKKIYPPVEKIFEAFNLCPFETTKVVILGQDPYHGPRQAHGLSFSVPSQVAPPPSLVNIFQERKNDLGLLPSVHGDLTIWAKQGVLLLNSILTVEHRQPGSHAKRGWEKFTDAVIHLLAENNQRLVFMLWGNYAQQKGNFIDSAKHLVLKAGHPSPFSAHRGFFNSKPFSQANAYLLRHNKKPINW